MTLTPKTNRITVPKLLTRKTRQQKIVMVTAYDATFARLFDASDVDIVLVGDSLGMLIQGHPNTIPVTIDDIVYHCRAVSRGLLRAHLCADMPFLSTKTNSDRILELAARIIQDGRAESVKIEGGSEMAAVIDRIVRAGIPVMGHVGMKPQSVHTYGGFRTQGKSQCAAQQIREDAIAVADAGAFCIVLEGIPNELAKEITKTVPVPTIGIAAGPDCDGQVLVGYDLLGINDQFCPSFVKRYAQMATDIQSAISLFSHEVRTGQFPSTETPETGNRNIKKTEMDHS